MPASSQAFSLGVVLIGHGAPATDCPPELIGELMSLEWRKNSHATGPQQLTGRAAELDAKIRDWPRYAGNDPYKRGLEQLAEALRPLLPTTRFAIGYNEFCRPTIAEAIAQVIQQGARRVFVIPTMLTPGGVHSEIDIPRSLEQVRAAHPGVAIDYLWPFDLRQVAALLGAHVNRALQVLRNP
jgi:sirohydrochlorin cobaltochelatase